MPVSSRLLAAVDPIELQELGSRTGQEQEGSREIVPCKNLVSKAHLGREAHFSSSVPPTPSIMTTLNTLPVRKEEIFAKPAPMITEQQ